MRAWVCWKASQFDAAQVCRHEGCDWAVISTIPRGFTRCDECEGGGWEPLPPFDGTIERISKPCPSCSGSGLVPTEKLREDVLEAINLLWDEMMPGAAPLIDEGLLADAVLRKVAEHIAREND